jgi:TPP-dependent pyruvate/acetoin dehydrogenase alpha subunit
MRGGSTSEPPAAGPGGEAAAGRAGVGEPSHGRGADSMKRKPVSNEKKRKPGAAPTDVAAPFLPGPLVPMVNPGLSRERLLELHHFLCLNRLVEDRLVVLYRQGHVPGSLYGSHGQEAISVGTAAALERSDLLAPMIRNIGSLLVRGVTPRDLFLQFFARYDGPTHGKDGTLHFGNVARRALIGPISVLGSLIPVMAGAALGARLRGERRVALTYIGDGGTSTGYFHEGLNFAATMRLPLILVVENNGYAFGTPTDRQFAVARLAQRGPAYGVAAETVDGTDVLAVYEATRRAIERGRRGGGPTLLECLALRMGGHAQHDDMRYVPPETLAAWRAHDPLARFEAFLVEQGHATPDDLRAVAARLEPQLEETARGALECPAPPPEETLRGVYCEPGYETPWWPGEDRPAEGPAGREERPRWR